MRVLVALILVLGSTLSSVSYGESWGEFIGKVIVEWLPDGRNMKLMEAFAYVDPHGQRWNAPAGSVVDGASIPQFAWSIIGGPFEGKYRDASVIHDAACRSKERPWQDVHEPFYTAMLASGVETIRAKVMYAAVYHFGPRWGRTINFSNVPTASVASKVAYVKATAGKDNEVLSEVRPRPPALGGPTYRSPQPQMADVSVRVVPHPPVRAGESDAMNLKVESATRESALVERIQESLRTVTKLGGNVELVATGSLPNDGKVIDDARKYD